MISHITRMCLFFAGGGAIGSKLGNLFFDRKIYDSSKLTFLNLFQFLNKIDIIIEDKKK
jgi:hypothetical protein